MSAYSPQLLILILYDTYHTPEICSNNQGRPLDLGLRDSGVGPEVSA